jgi:addiction module HigA family antidote
MRRPPIHPGQILAEQLVELGLSAAGLARQIRVPATRISGILKGQRAVSVDTALRLAHFFGTSAEFWLNLQQAYALRVARQSSVCDLKRLPRLGSGPRDNGHRRRLTA